MAVTRELIVFLYFILLGIAGGIFLDILRAFRHNRVMHDFTVYVEDILYWIILGCGVIWLSCILNTGTVRLFMIFGLFLGMLIYFLTLTKVVYKVFDFVCRYLSRVMRWFLEKTAFSNQVTLRGKDNIDEKEKKLA